MENNHINTIHPILDLALHVIILDIFGAFPTNRSKTNPPKNTQEVKLWCDRELTMREMRKQAPVTLQLHFGLNRKE